MIQSCLHAIDLATAGNLEGAHIALEGLREPVALRLRDLFAQWHKDQLLKGELQAMIRHDLANSLAIVQANVEAILDGVLEPTPARFRGMRDALESSSRLLDDWRNPSKHVQAKLPIRAVTLNMCALIAAQYSVIEGLAADKSVSVIYEPCGANHAACAQFRGDPQRIGQVLRNILINAVRFTPPRGEVRLSCDLTDGNLRLTIRDTGPGIEPGDLPHIFEPGYRAAKTAQGPGSGLGLSVASLLLEAIGGRAQVIRQEGPGTAFVITLPIRPSAQ